VLIFCDVEAKNLQLAPGFFDRKKCGSETLVFPDRIRLTVEAIKNGKGAMFLGGWLSFTGELGRGGWNRSGLKEVLPVIKQTGDPLLVHGKVGNGSVLAYMPDAAHHAVATR
jgi:uncharacterized membrane protein